MARYSGGGTATIAGTTLRPNMALSPTASVTGKIREVAIFNTTAVAATYRLVRFTAGTAGTGLVEAKHDPLAATASCTLLAGWTADATIGDDLGYRAALGAAIGSGAIFTFGDTGLVLPVGTTNGIGFVPVGTGQICEVYFVWDE